MVMETNEVWILVLWISRSYGKARLIPPNSTYWRLAKGGIVDGDARIVPVVLHPLIL